MGTKVNYCLLLLFCFNFFCLIFFINYTSTSSSLSRSSSSSSSSLSSQFPHSQSLRKETRNGEEKETITSTITDAQVGILIRAHDGYKHQLFSLLWGFLSQSYSNGQYLLVLPTELSSLTLLSQYLHSHWDSSVATTLSSSHTQAFHVQFLQVPLEIFTTNCCQLELLCNKEWRQNKLSEGYSEYALRRYCEVNSPLHYHLTDYGLHTILNNCPTCQYLLVTNADNSYSPKYLELTIQKMEEEQVDLVLTNMVHLGQAMNVAPELGKMDLGCALIKINFLRHKKISFVTSLPVPTEPQHWHDADYWLIQTMINSGARVAILPQILFTHN